MSSILLVTIFGIIFLSEFLTYRVLKELNEDMFSYIPEMFVRIGCYAIIIFLFIIWEIIIKTIHI
jgi:hypothetical protein